MSVGRDARPPCRIAILPDGSGDFQWAVVRRAGRGHDSLRREAVADGVIAISNCRIGARRLHALPIID